MNKTETVIAQNKSMGMYCLQITDTKIVTRSMIIERTPRGYFDLCDLLDCITTTHQATTTKRVLLDAFFRFPHARMIQIICICFLNVSEGEDVHRIMRSHARQPQRSITVRRAFDPNDCTITATIVMHPHQYWKIEQRFFPDSQKE